MTDSTSLRAAEGNTHESAGGGETAPGVLCAVDSKTYYVRVDLIGAGGEQRRATVEIDGTSLRGLTLAQGSPPKARDWIRRHVRVICQEHPQDLTMGPARWRTVLGLSLSESVHKAIQTYLAARAAPKEPV